MVTLHTDTGIISVWKLENQGEFFLYMSRAVALVKNTDFTFCVDLKGNVCNVDNLRKKIFQVRETQCVYLKGSHWRHRQRKRCSSVSLGSDLMAYNVSHFMVTRNYRMTSIEK